MSGLVHAQKTELAILAHLTILGAFHDEGSISGGVIFLGMGVLQGEGDGLAAKPVAYVVCVAINEGDADTVVEDALKVGLENGVDEIARGLESICNGGVGLGIVKVDTDGLLCLCGVKEVDKVAVRSGVVVRVADVVNTAATVGIIGAFDIVTAHIGRLSADVFADGGGTVGLTAVVNLVEATVAHEAGEFHVVVNCLVDSLNAVGIVDSKFRVVWGLNGFVNDTVDYTKGVEVEFDSLAGAV